MGRWKAPGGLPVLVLHSGPVDFRACFLVRRCTQGQRPAQVVLDTESGGPCLVSLKGCRTGFGSRARLRGAAIARQLEASEFHVGETYQLRLLERPLYTYSDVDHGLIEGTLFAFAYGTNPEILLQLEARDTKDGPKWQAAFARLSSAEITVKLNDDEIWKVPAVRDFDARESYYAAIERDEAR